MKRKITACVAISLLAGAVYAQDITLALSLPKQSFRRGVNVPVEGLTARLVIANPTHVTVFMSKPIIHPEAASASAAKAMIRRIGEDGRPGALLPPITGMAPPFTVTALERLRIKPESQAVVSIEIGSHYLIRKPGDYEMSIVFRGIESNKVRFTVLPLRRLTLPKRFVLERIEDIEWGDPDYDEMFYVVSCPRAWDEIVLVQRLGKRQDYPLMIIGVGFIASGKMPEMIIQAPGVYALLYPEKTGKGWVMSRIDCSKDPFVSKYKQFPGDEKPSLSAALAEMP